MKHKTTLLTFDELSQISSNTILIFYEWWSGKGNMGFWTATLDGELIDYHTKESLIKQAQKMGKNYMVLKYHKGKNREKISIVSQGK